MMGNRHVWAVLALLVACSDKPAAPGGDASSDAATEATGCAACGERVNATEPEAKTYQGFKWQSYAFQPSCAYTATHIMIRSNAKAVGLLADANGEPGAVLVPETVTEDVGGGWRRATFAPVALDATKTYYVAMKNTEGGLTSTLSSAALTGRDLQGFISSNLDSGWSKMGMVKSVFGIGTSCL